MFGFLVTLLIGKAVCHEMDNYAEELNMKCCGMYNDLRHIDGVTDITIANSCDITFSLKGNPLRIIKIGEQWMLQGLDDNRLVSVLENMAKTPHKKGGCHGRKKIMIQ